MFYDHVQIDGSLEFLHNNAPTAAQQKHDSKAIEKEQEI